MGADLIGQQLGARLRGPRGEQGGLATGPGAQVEPPLIAALHRSVRRNERHQLTALVLDPGPAVADRIDPARVSPDHDDGERTDPAGARLDVVSPVGLAGGLGQRLRRDKAGPGTQGHLGVGVVRGQERLELLAAATVGDQGLAQRLDDPLRVRLGAGQSARFIGCVPA